MYTPAHFREDRPEVLHELIARHPLATLVASTRDGLEATHVPLLLEGGVLRGHVARANPLAQGAASAIAIFQGGEQYISPSWYASKKTDPRVVPTWNYIAVHAHGPLRTFAEKGEILRIVSALTVHMESRRAEPWAIEDAPAEYIDRLLNAIIGIAIPIERIEGKWKQSQNRPAEDQASVRAALESGGF